MTASRLSISLAQLGQRGAMSRSVTPYGLASSSSSVGLGLGAGLAALGAGLGAGRASCASSARAAKVLPQPLQRIFLPSTSAGALICLSHSGQVIVTVAMARPSPPPIRPRAYPRHGSIL